MSHKLEKQQKKNSTKYANAVGENSTALAPWDGMHYSARHREEKPARSKNIVQERSP